MTIDKSTPPTSRSESLNSLVEVYVEEYMEQVRQGTAPSIAEFVKSHPEHAAELHELLETVLVVNRLGAQSEPATKYSDFPEIKDYKLIRIAGRGGMGVVYEAIQKSLDRRVALKVLPDSILQNLVARERFQLEARTAAKLHHTNIVPVFEVGEHNGHCFYAMQFIEGDTLDVVVRKLLEIRRITHPDRAHRGKSPVSEPQPQDSSLNPRAQSLARSSVTTDVDATQVTTAGQNLPQPQANIDTQSQHFHESSTVGSASDSQPFFNKVARIGFQAAVALQYAHEHGVVHRDIKPSNLILDVSGHVWITDFGLAKLADTDNLTRAGDVVGTLRYMPPERFSGQCDGRSDIYSLGATLYELIALQPPFQAKDRVELINKIRQADVPKLRSFSRRVPYDLQTIIAKSMEVEPNHRYHSAREMSQDLERFMHGQPVRARRVSSVERLWLWSKKNVGLAASLAMILLLLLVGAIGATLAAVVQTRLAAEKAAESSEAQKQRDEAYRNAYFADIRQAQQDWENGHTRRMLTALQRYVPSVDNPDVRGWEWFYLLSLAHQDEATFSDFEGTATQIQWTRDGQRIISCGSDGTLCVRDRQGKLLVSITIPDLRQFALNYNDTQVATVSQDEVLRIWDTNSGELVQTIRLPNRQLISVGWGRIPNLIVVAARPNPDIPDGELILLDRFTEFVLQRHDTSSAIANWLNIHPQGDGLAVGGPGIGVTIGFLTKPEVISIGAAQIGHIYRVTCTTWHPDGRRIAVGTETQGIRVFEIDRNATEPKLLFRIDDSTTADAVTFSTDGQQMFVGNRSQRIDVYDMDSQRKVTSFKGHLGRILSLAAHPSENLIASSSSDGSIKLWRTNEVDSSAPANPQQNSQGQSPDGSWNWQQFGNQVVVTDSTSGKELVRLAPFDASARDTAAPAQVKLFPKVHRALFWPTSDRAGGPRRIWVCDTSNWKVLGALTNSNWQVPWADIRGDFAIVAERGTVQLFDGRTGDIHSIIVTSGSPPGLNDRVEDFDSSMVVVLSPGGDQFVTCSGAEVKIWDSAKRVELATLVGHRPGAFVARLGWSNHGRLFATGSSDQSIVIWDAQQRSAVQTLRGLQDTADPELFGFNHDDTRFIAADSLNLKLWDVRSGRELLSFERSPQAASAFKKFVESDSAAKLGLTDAALSFAQLAKSELLRHDQVAIDRFQHDMLLGLARLLVFSTHNNPPERALTLSQQALRLKPTDSQSQFIHAMALYRAGAFPQALQGLKLASDSGLADDYALKILYALCLKYSEAGHDTAAAVTAAFEALNSVDEIDLVHSHLVFEFADDFLPREPMQDEPSRIVVNTLRDTLDEDPTTTSLREALLLAPDQTTIEISVSGTIELKFGPLEIQKSLQIIGPGSDQLAISGRNKSRLLIIDDREPTTMSQVELTGIRFTAGQSDANIHSRNVEYRDSPRGCLYLCESLTMTDCRLDENHNFNGWGGAIFAEGGSVLKILRTTFASNTALSAGAVFISGNTVTDIDSCTFDGNEHLARTTGSGGAILNWGRLTVVNSTFSRNRAHIGGTIDVPAADNQVSIEHCTFSQNIGGAFDTHRFAFPRHDLHMKVTNCILWGNTDHQGQPLDMLALDDVQAELSHCIVGVAQGGYLDQGGNLVGIDPLLGPLADNGGTTQTHALLEGSPAIDAAEITDTGQPLEFDQRGKPYRRIVDGDGNQHAIPDIGAFELQSGS